MKKIIKLLIALLVMISLVGCGEVTVTNDTVDDGSTEETNLDIYLGDYEDAYSQRAQMSVTLNDDGSLQMVVDWSSSAFEYTEWVMNATLDGDKLTYSDCKETNYSEENEEVVYENQAGYFEIDGSSLKWTGAYDENCKECIFKKVTLEDEEFNNCLDEIYNIQPGSAGTSSRVEEAAATVKEFLDGNGASYNMEDFANLTLDYLNSNDIDTDRMLDSINELKDSGELDDYTNFELFYDGVIINVQYE